MLSVGLTGPQEAKYLATLATSHSINVTLQVLDLNGNRLADVSRRLLDGQVDCDANADVTRTCTLSLLDPRRTIHFESDSPGDGAIYLDRMLRVIYSVAVPTVGWVDASVFCGPVTKMDRADDIVHLECMGKEVLAQGAAWNPLTFKKGHNKIAAIRTILSTRAGETRFTLPNSSARLPRDFSLARESNPWDAAKTLATSINKQLYYDGRGICMLRSKPGTVTTVFVDGEGGMVLTEPQVAYSDEGLKNMVWVKGGTPAGAKSPISVAKAAPVAHPLSPMNLGRNQVPRYLLEVIENDQIVSVAEATALAQQTLNERLLQHIDVSFDALPFPLLDPLDMCRVATSEFAAEFQVKSWSLPLSTGQGMAIGYQKDVSPNRSMIRRRR